MSDSSEYLPSESRGLQPHCTAAEWKTLTAELSADWRLDEALTGFHFGFLHLLLGFQLPIEKRGSPKGSCSEKQSTGDSQKRRRT